jgi:L-fuculose-phosphate aldolase
VRVEPDLGTRHAGLDPDEARHAVLATGRELAARDLVVGTVGNVSARVPDGLVITPTRMAYDGMRPDDLITVGLDGAVRDGRHRPSRELPMHLAIYRARPDVGAIVHTHSVHATAWSFLGEPLEPTLEECAYYDIPAIATSAPARAGSEELAARAVAALGSSRAALLGRHGVVAVGATPADALTIALVVERQAHVAWLLRSASARRAGIDPGA